jgi:hypothetical protein
MTARTRILSESSEWIVPVTVNEPVDQTLSETDEMVNVGG